MHNGGIMNKVLFAILLGLLQCIPAYSQVSFNRKVDGTYFPGIKGKVNHIKNPFCDPRFGSADGGITAVGSPTLTTGTALDAGHSCRVTGDQVGDKFFWSTNTLSVGGNCMLYAKYKGDGTKYKIYLANSSGTQLSSAVTLRNSGTDFFEERINYPCTASARAYAEVETASPAAFDIAWYYGEPDNLGLVAQASFIGSLKYLGAANCVWTTTSTSLAALAADTDCSTPTVTTGSGTVAAPGTKIPGIVASNLAPGTYKVTAKGNVSKSGTTDAIVSAALNDGTTTCAAQSTYGGATSGIPGFPMTMVCYFTYTTAQSSITFQVYGVTNSGLNTFQLATNTANQADFEIAVEYIPSANQQAVSISQSNFDWTTCPTITGSWSTNTTYTCVWQRRGSNAFFNIKVATSGAPTSAALTVNLPITIDTAKLTTTDFSTPLGLDAVNDSSSTGYTGIVAYNSTTSVAPKIPDVAAQIRYTAIDQVTPITFGSGDSVTLNFSVPVVGWIENGNAPLLVGSVTSGTSGMLRIETAKFNCSASSSVASSSSSWLTVANISSNRCALTFAAGTFSATPTCSAVPMVTDMTTLYSPAFSVTTATAGSIGLKSQTGATTGNVSSWETDLICVGPR